MLKNILILLILSAVISLLDHFYAAQLTQALQLVPSLYHWFSDTLKIVFSQGTLGEIIRNTIVLTILPLLVGLIVFGISRLFKRATHQHVMIAFWFSWLVLVSTVFVQKSLIIA